MQLKQREKKQIKNIMGPKGTMNDDTIVQLEDNWDNLGLRW